MIDKLIQIFKMIGLIKKDPPAPTKTRLFDEQDKQETSPKCPDCGTTMTKGWAKEAYPSSAVVAVWYCGCRKSIFMNNSYSSYSSACISGVSSDGSNSLSSSSLTGIWSRTK